MKTVFISLLLFLGISLKAQTVTNIEVRYTINSDTALRTTLNLSSTNKNEKAFIEALVWHHVNTGSTNTLHQWAAKTWTKDKLKELKDAKDEQDTAIKALRESIDFVLKFQAEDLTAQMKSNLAEVAALKAQ